MYDSIQLVRELVMLRGPSGQEGDVTSWLRNQVQQLGFGSEIDAKGNLLVRIEGHRNCPKVVVTAHLDEIAMIITKIEIDGSVRVAPIGGAFTFKWGEGPVEILTSSGIETGVLSFGCIHTNNPQSVIEKARSAPYPWEDAYVFTGLTSAELANKGVRPGLRVVLSQSRRVVTEFGDFVSSYFLDDRADIVVWLLALEAIKNEGTAGIGSGSM